MEDGFNIPITDLNGNQYKAKVLELNRVCIGNYYLPKDLKEGEVIEIFDSELDHIKEKI